MIILIRRKIYGAKSERSEKKRSKMRHEKEFFLPFSHFEFTLGGRNMTVNVSKESDDTSRIFKIIEYCLSILVNDIWYFQDEMFVWRILYE